MIELTLGPLLFNWPSGRIIDFYERIAAEAPVARVYLGEIVCSKRLPFTGPVLAHVAETLAAAGKTVVWSSLALPSTTREQRLIAELAACDDEIEINDMGALACRNGRPFTAGPLLNIYNEDALAQLRRLGCTRLAANVELSVAAIGRMTAAHSGFPVELFAFGRLPLALSGRCYHARAHGLHKDACQFVCERDPDGRDIRTLDGTGFLAMNGIQTLSHGVQAAALPLSELTAAGITALRLSPHTVDMVAVANLFAVFCTGRIDAAELTADLRGLNLPGPVVNGYVRGQPGHMTA